MKLKIAALFIIVFQFTWAQLDSIHYLQPLASPNTVDGITEEYLYLSTPSTSNIIVHITFPDEINSPKIMVGNALGSGEIEVNNGMVTLSNSNPIRIRFIDSALKTIKPGTSTSPITPSMSLAGRVIAANEGAGLILKSDNQFYAHYRGRSQYQAGSMLSNGRSALGKNFFWVGLPVEKSPGSTSTVNNVLSIMATEDNTSITLNGFEEGLTFLKDSNSTGWTSGSSFSFELNKGESFIFVVTANATELQRTGWLGAEITANKSIIATVAGLMQQGEAAENRDISLDQIIPVNQLGDTYVSMQGNGSNTLEKAIVIATEDNTDILVNDVYLTTINKGDFYIVPGSYYGSNKYMKITTTKNTYVVQKLYGTTSGTTSNFMLLPPLSCSGQTTIDNIANALRIGSTAYTTNSRLYLLTRTIMVGNTFVYIDGVQKSPDATSTKVVAPGWTMLVYNLSHGNVKVVSNGTIQGQILGANGDAGYGNYFSGFGIIPKMKVEVDFKRFDQVCTGDTGSTLLKPFSSGYSGKIQWYKNDELIPNANSATYLVPETDTEPAIYTMVITLEDGCSYYSESIQTVKCPCAKLPNTEPGIPYKGIVGVSTAKDSKSN